MGGTPLPGRYGAAGNIRLLESFPRAEPLNLGAKSPIVQRTFEALPPLASNYSIAITFTALTLLETWLG